MSSRPSFETRPSYVGTKSDYYTHVRDIPPQYGDGHSDNTKVGRCRLKPVKRRVESVWLMSEPVLKAPAWLMYEPG